MTFTIGDTVKRISSYSHRGHEPGHVCVVTSLYRGTHFHDGGPGRDVNGRPYMYSMSNYELVKGAVKPKLKSGFGKWFRSQSEHQEASPNGKISESPA